MIKVNNVSLSFGKRILFKDVDLEFSPGNCYGLIGANGAGKSTFLKILSGEIEATKGDVLIGRNLRLGVLKQDQFAFDAFTVLDTVIMGHKKLFQLMKERDILYSKKDFSEKDGIRISEIENEFLELDGYEAEASASVMLTHLGLSESFHQKLMNELDGKQKVRVLLAQAMFGNPDILLLDEPTNNLDLKSKSWLEEFLYNFENTAIVVSHDRHFLNKVCTHITDIDYGKIKSYVGNYDFWYQASQLSLRQLKDENKKKEEKVNALKDFISRFSSNASKAKQATSRKKLLENLTLAEIPVSSRKFPYIDFKPQRPSGKIILQVENLNVEMNGKVLFKEFNLTVNKGDKIALVGQNDLIKTMLFETLTGNVPIKEPGNVTWGTTINYSYFPKEHSRFFQSSLNIIDWLRQFSEEKSENYIRGFLGRMLFSGEESLKKVSVLSGGEKVRCLLSKMMISGSNVLVFDDPTNHLDLEAITALNDGLIRFPEVILFSSHDHQFIDTVANRIIEITPNGIIDKGMRFDDYVQDEEIQARRKELYDGQSDFYF